MWVKAVEVNNLLSAQYHFSKGKFNIGFLY
uniref:Uncharacterized protein n=1 Tax=Rhizophora mucronata TaxID=61149 RepID=A0A2P2PWG7_RHIMU